MKFKTYLTSLILATTMTAFVLSCSSEEVEPIIDSDNDESTWLSNDSTPTESDIIGYTNVKFTSDFNLSELFNQSRANNMYTVTLSSGKKGSDGLYQVQFKPKGLEIRYKTENLAWFPTLIESYDITVLANHNSDVKIGRPYGKVSGVAPKQELAISIDVTYNEDGIITTCRLGFIAKLNGNKVEIRDMNQILP